MQDMHNNLIEKQVKDLSRHFFFPKKINDHQVNKNLFEKIFVPLNNSKIIYNSQNK